METHEIEIASDTPDATSFCQYLNGLGHSASIGRSTGNYIDGVWTSSHTESSAIMNDLWEAFCNAPAPEGD